MPSELAEYRGLHIRTDTNADRVAVGDVRRYDVVELRKTDVVLDVGAHIGAYSALVAERVKKVVAIEPDPQNYRLLVRNTGRIKNVVRTRAAVVHDSDFGRTRLYEARWSTMHSSAQIRGRKHISVPAVSFRSLLRTHRPTVLKIDIEGGEYDLMDELLNLPKRVRVIAAELHLGRNEWLRNAHSLLDVWDEQFDLVKHPRVGPYERTWELVGVRDA